MAAVNIGNNDKDVVDYAIHNTNGHCRVVKITFSLFLFFILRHFLRHLAEPFFFLFFFFSKYKRGGARARASHLALRN